MSLLKDHFNEIVTIIVTALVLILAFATGTVQSQVSLKSLLLSTAIVTVIFVLAVLVVVTIFRKKFEKNIFEAIGKSKTGLDESIATNQCNADGFIDILHKTFNIGTIPGWLLTTDELMKFEAENADSEVWIITSDLLEDGIDGPFFDVVKNNLEKGVIYRYFLPDDDVVRMETKRIKDKIGTLNKGKVIFRFLDDDFFFLFSKFDFGIINPQASCGKRYGFMGITTPDGNNNRFQIRLSDNLVREFIAKLERYKQ